MTPELVIRVTGRETDILVGRYLRGPSDAKAVQLLGYAFTPNEAEAWPFETHGKAMTKLRILARHMGMSEMQFEVVRKGAE